VSARKFESVKTDCATATPDLGYSFGEKQ